VGGGGVVEGGGGGGGVWLWLCWPVLLVGAAGFTAVPQPTRHTSSASTIRYFIPYPQFLLRADLRLAGKDFIVPMKKTKDYERRGNLSGQSARGHLPLGRCQKPHANSQSDAVMYSEVIAAVLVSNCNLQSPAATARCGRSSNRYGTDITASS